MMKAVIIKLWILFESPYKTERATGQQNQNPQKIFTTNKWQGIPIASKKEHVRTNYQQISKVSVSLKEKSEENGQSE